MKDRKSKDALRIAINLDDENAQKFLEIQKALGIKNSTDVLRFLINWYHTQNFKEKA